MRWQRSTRTPLLVAALALAGPYACSSADSSAAREQSAEPGAEEAPHTVPTGTSLVFSVDQLVSTATHARGDVFSATLRNRVTDVEGGEAIPEGVPSQWIVTEATTEDGATVLAIRLESIKVNGAWTPLVADVTEAHVRTPADSGTAPGAEVAVGTAAEEALVEILGENGVLPGAVGPDSGTLVTLTTHGRSATLPAGSAITVQLTEPLQV
ncbi:MAG: hypothetical protein AB7T31_02040 [Gemmatimonadales bacterium]